VAHSGLCVLIVIESTDVLYGYGKGGGNRLNETNSSKLNVERLDYSILNWSPSLKLANCKSQCLREGEMWVTVYFGSWKRHTNFGFDVKMTASDKGIRVLKKIVYTFLQVIATEIM
jgi:hypothetical protein